MHICQDEIICLISVLPLIQPYKSKLPYLKLFCRLNLHLKRFYHFKRNTNEKITNEDCKRRSSGDCCE